MPHDAETFSAVQCKTVRLVNEMAASVDPLAAIGVTGEAWQPVTGQADLRSGQSRVMELSAEIREQRVTS